MPATKIEGFPIRKPHQPITLEMIQARTVEEGECWIWQGALSHGQPALNWNRKTTNVRRYMAENVMGLKVKGRLASTCCGNGACVAPHHVSIKTRKQLQTATARNTRYGDNLARKIKLAEAARSRSKLTLEIAQQIREAEGPQRAIAKRFGVAFDTVNKIKNGVTWRDYSSPWAGLLPPTKAKP